MFIDTVLVKEIMAQPDNGIGELRKQTMRIKQTPRTLWTATDIFKNYVIRNKQPRKPQKYDIICG